MASSRYLVAALLLVSPFAAFAGAQPVGVLTMNHLVARTDTVETYSRQGPSPLVRSGSYVRAVSGSSELGWTIEFRWYDTTGWWTTTQRTETRRGSLATRVQIVRALTDSASLLVEDGRATGWVVPAGQHALLVDGPAITEFTNSDVAVLAIAASRPSPGTEFVVPRNTLFSANPISVATDTLRALAPARVRFNGRQVDCQTVVSASGNTYWVERATGRLLARRRSVGSFTFWHLVKGVTPPEA
jgi:hypothetical protein